MCKKILFLYDNAQVETYLLSDLILCKNVELLTIKKTRIGKIFIGNRSLIKKVLKKINLLDNFTNIIKFYNLSKLLYKKNNFSIIIIQAQLLNSYNFSFFYKIARKFNLKLCLWIIDSVHASSPTFKSILPEIFNNQWDKIYTYDDFDAKEFGWTCFNKNYFSTYKYPKPNPNQNIKYDIYFTGGIKGNKEELLFKSFTYLKQNNLNPFFSLYCYNNDQLIKYKNQFPEIYFFNIWRDYSQIVEEVIHSKCILEILQQGQKTQTLRYFEAIYFNKKLLTNNPNIFNLPYYNPDYMMYFNKIEDIDINWIKKDINVDYKYKNDFSPVNFIKQVNKDFNLELDL